MNVNIETPPGQFGKLSSRIVETQDRMAQPITEVMGDQIVARVEDTMEPLSRRIADLERTLRDLSNRSAALQEDLVADLSSIEQSLAKHAAAIDSAHTAIAQTDTLVERVVEALELT
jgi:predicted  nucleic acid-binding Zn-ribbon protein